MGSLFEFLTLVIFLIIVGAFVYVMVTGIFNHAKTSNVPASRATATVKSKRTEASENSVRPAAYFVTFDAEGEDLELAVSPKEYETLECGKTGELYHKGTSFLTFEPKKEQ